MDEQNRPNKFKNNFNLCNIFVEHFYNLPLLCSETSLTGEVGFR